MWYPNRAQWWVFRIRILVFIAAVRDLIWALRDFFPMLANIEVDSHWGSPFYLHRNTRPFGLALPVIGAPLTWHMAGRRRR
jgi:hypothetical protein